MNAIGELFEKQRQSGRKLLSLYFCAGHPDPEGTARTILELQAGGVDMVEVGIPFSDPLADGPVIQAAATSAIRGGMTLAKIFAAIGSIRDRVRIPLVLMGYYNVIHRFGNERFCEACAECGVSGAIIPDLPYERYLVEMREAAQRHGISVIQMVTPETPPERIREIDAGVSGFLYMVSSAGITGARDSYSEEAQAYFARVAGMGLRNPLMVGFGVSNRATFECAGRYAAGAIIGTKFVGLLGENGGDAAAALKVLREELQK